MKKWLLELDKLLVMRGIAAVAVVIYHVQDSFRPALLNRFSLFGVDLSWLFLPSGKMAVVLFFVLSGYLMFKMFLDGRHRLDLKGVVRFWVSRCARIMPLYYFLVFFFIIFIAPRMLEPQNFGTLLQILTFTYEGDPVFVTAFWSISTEIQFYLLVPLLYFISTRIMTSHYSRIAALIAILAACAVIRYLFIDSVNASPNSIPHLIIFFDAFIVGAASAYVVRSLKQLETLQISQNQWLTVALFTGATILPFASLYWLKLDWLGYNTLGVTAVSLYAALFIIAAEMATTKNYVKKNFKLSNVVTQPKLIPEFIGATSYGLYLWHTPVMEKMQHFPIVNPASMGESVARVAMVSSIALVCAYLSYKYVEGYKAESPFADRISSIIASYVNRSRNIARSLKKPKPKPLLETDADAV